MKQNLTIVFTLLLTSFSLIGQNIKEIESSMSLGRQNSHFLEIDDAKLKTVEDAFKDYMKGFGKVNFNKKAKEYFGSQISIPAMGNVPVDFYAKMEERANQVTLYVWADLGPAGGGFINSKSHASQANGVKVFLEDFFVYTKKILITNELKEQEKLLSNLEKDLSKLVNKNEDYLKDIEKAKAKIAQAEKDILENKQAQAEKTKEIEAKKEDIKAVTTRLNNVGKN